MIKVDIDTIGAQHQLRNLLKQVSTPRQALKDIAAAWKTEVQLGFRSGTDPWGAKWARRNTQQ